MGSSGIHHTALHQIWWKSAQQIWKKHVDRNTHRYKILSQIAKCCHDDKIVPEWKKKCQPFFLCPTGSIEHKKQWLTRIYMKRSQNYTMTYTSTILNVRMNYTLQFNPVILSHSHFTGGEPRPFDTTVVYLHSTKTLRRKDRRIQLYFFSDLITQL